MALHRPQRPLTEDKKIYSVYKELERKSCLFIHSGGPGVMIKNENGNYSIFIENVHPYLTYFSSSVHMYPTIVRLDRFLDEWKDSKGVAIENRGPTAIISVLLSGNTINVAVQMVGKSYDKEMSRVHYEVSPYVGNQSVLPEEAFFESVTIFINGRNTFGKVFNKNVVNGETISSS